MSDGAAGIDVLSHGGDPVVGIVGTTAAINDALDLDGRGIASKLRDGVVVVRIDSPQITAEAADTITAATEGVPTVVVTAAHRNETPIAFFDRAYPDAIDVAAELPTPWAVDTGGADAEWSLDPTTVGAVVFEIGVTDPTEAVDDLLRSLGILDADADAEVVSPAFYTIADRIDADPETRTDVENFEPVPKLSVFGTHAGDRLVANWTFYPVLFGECGDGDTLGYRAKKIGDDAATARAAFAPGRLGD
ncbi:MAG: hypothetical protein PPP58_08720 [Natronomonas sp.]